VLDKFKVFEFMARNRITNQSELALRLGVTRQALSGWLTGRERPSMEKLIALCQELNCTFNDIVVLPKESALAIPTFQSTEQSIALVA
jgi:transcriptional regulator with XRE-family HTH domain